MLSLLLWSLLNVLILCRGAFYCDNEFSLPAGCAQHICLYLNYSWGNFEVFASLVVLKFGVEESTYEPQKVKLLHNFRV